eukprot:7417889-Pyramimonas_sp.AAC.1
MLALITPTCHPSSHSSHPFAMSHFGVRVSGGPSAPSMSSDSGCEDSRAEDAAAWAEELAAVLGGDDGGDPSADQGAA